MAGGDADGPLRGCQRGVRIAAVERGLGILQQSQHRLPIVEIERVVEPRLIRDPLPDVRRHGTEHDLGAGLACQLHDGPEILFEVPRDFLFLGCGHVDGVFALNVESEQLARTGRLRVRGIDRVRRAFQQVAHQRVDTRAIEQRSKRIELRRTLQDPLVEAAFDEFVVASVDDEQVRVVPGQFGCEDPQPVRTVGHRRRVDGLDLAIRPRVLQRRAQQMGEGKLAAPRKALGARSAEDEYAQTVRWLGRGKLLVVERMGHRARRRAVEFAVFVQFEHAERAGKTLERVPSREQRSTAHPEDELRDAEEQQHRK